MAGAPLDDGMLVVRDGRILAVGAYSDLRPKYSGEVTDLGDVILLPGLINAHCHLDFTVMRGAILNPTSFTTWIRRINDLKRTLTDADYLASIAAGFAELKRWGTTSVLNIESFPELMVQMPTPPIRTWWFYELLDIRNRIHTEEVVAGALSFFESRPNWKGGFGLSPHAPYTTSIELYQLARSCTEQHGMPLTTHLAETDEELAMFSEGAGPLWQFLSGLGREMNDTGSTTPIRHLLDANALPDGAILAHMNQLGPGDEALLAQVSSKYPIVHCPNCHAFFGRPPFPYKTLRGLGFQVSLGTDSCASNSGLNLFSEMRRFQSQFPAVAPEEIVRMVTRHPARALGHENTLGVFSPGAFADFITIPDDRSRDPFEQIVSNQDPPREVFLEGQRA